MRLKLAFYTISSEETGVESNASIRGSKDWSHVSLYQLLGHGVFELSALTEEYEGESGNVYISFGSWVLFLVTLFRPIPVGAHFP